MAVIRGEGRLVETLKDLGQGYLQWREVLCTDPFGSLLADL